VTKGPIDNPATILLEIGDLNGQAVLEKPWDPPDPIVLIMSEDPSHETRLPLRSRRIRKNGRHE
jgi:hypothetical protein